MYKIYKELLEKSGLKTSDVSKATGISPQVFTNWKRRGGNMSYENLLKIADFFNVDVSLFSKSNSQFDMNKLLDSMHNAMDRQIKAEYPGYDMIANLSDESIDIAIEYHNADEETQRMVKRLLAYSKKSKPHSLID